MRPLLAIETSQRAGSVAVDLGDPDGTVDDEQLHGRHDEDLVAAIDRLLRRHAVERHGLAAIAVSIGPGGFTGLRVGVATAKMMAFALNIPTVAVPTAAVVAESVSPRSGDRVMMVVLAVKDDRFWAACFRHDGTRWHAAGTPSVMRTDDVDLGDVGVIVGDRYLPEPLRRRAGERDIAIVAPSFSALACARLGRRLLDAGDTIDPHRLLPLYARQPEVTPRPPVP